MRGTAVTWNETASIGSMNNTNGPARYLTGVSRVQVKKAVNGQWVTGLDRTAEGTFGTQISWDGSPVAGTQVTFEYRAVGDSAWQSLAVGGTSTRYVVDAGNLASGRYDYRITYRRPGETNAYAQGTGQFTVQGLTSANSRGVVGTVEAPFLSKSFSTTVGDEGMTGGGYTPVSYYQTVDHRIDLSWQSLEGWGGGDVQVIVDYTGNGFSGSQTRTLSAADGMRGTAVRWNETASIGSMNNTNGPARYLTGVSRVQVKKFVNGAWVSVYDQTAATPNRQLTITNLPAAANSVTLEYRKAGSTDPYLSKTTTKMGAGWFSASYDDVPVGAYEYRLTVKDATNNAIDLTSVGGNAQGQFSGTIEIRKGAQGIPDSPGNVVTNRTIASYNGFGEVIAKSLNGSSQEYFDYDQNGRLWRTNQQDGINKVYLYNLAGQATADIRSVTADLRTLTASQAEALKNAAVRTETIYDALGHAVSQRQPLYSFTAAPLESIPASLSVSQQLLAHSFTSTVGDEGMTGGGYTPLSY